MKYKITESQYNRILKELETEFEPTTASPLPNLPIDASEKDVDTLPSIDDIDDNLTQEQKLNIMEHKVKFLEDFFRDIVDFQEFLVSEVDGALNELTKGEIGLTDVIQRLGKLTTRGGRKKFYTAKRGFR